MRKILIGAVLAFAMLPMNGPAQESGPYRILKSAKVGGEGGWDYIYADSAGRRLYIPRRGGPPPGAQAGAPPAGAPPAAPVAATRLTIFNLDTLEPAGEIPGIGGNG